MLSLNLSSSSSSTRHPRIISVHNSTHLQPSIVTLKTSKQQQKFRIRAQKDDSNNNNNGFNFKWTDLLFDPDPNNIAAVGLTGLLTWASVQVLWQLFIISGAVLIAALKYTLVAVLLIFILITLL